MEFATDTAEQMIEQMNFARGYRNVEMVRYQYVRIVKGRIPRDVRNELMAGVRVGLLGHLAKKALAPEVFFHPDHLHAARDAQRNHFEYNVRNLKACLVRPLEEF